MPVIIIGADIFFFKNSVEVSMSEKEKPGKDW
ncbi:hypothetical protein SacN8_00430 [Sulfolobus acidocaldarius N8]|uniref:Uncharacterized protein n=2 Tax=Sulfolobus acidocaldarius TaxID=2285 RepID=M1IUR5_9CREN|nr:hypothetical protein SacN8_00430 [Sulfolobus acidocaldarius N8]AGE72342.1 hypothetical protein SacRon12I_00430 [Sulfolobus acidocaldarius Ron12/I]